MRSRTIKPSQSQVANQASQIRQLLATAAKSLQSCPTLCDPIDGSPPGAPVPGILQARTLEWVAISFSNAWKWKVKVKMLSRARLFATPWTAAHQAPRPWDSPGKSTGLGCHCLLQRQLLSSRQSNNSLAFLPCRLYRNLSPSSFWIIFSWTALLNWMSAQRNTWKF